MVRTVACPTREPGTLEGPISSLRRLGKPQNLSSDCFIKSMGQVPGAPYSPSYVPHRCCLQGQVNTCKNAVGDGTENRAFGLEPTMQGPQVVHTRHNKDTAFAPEFGLAPSGIRAS